MFFKRYTPEEKVLIKEIKRIVGTKPTQLSHYKLATIHTSVAKRSTDGIRKSYERLEYLGDAVLSSIVADYLYNSFPTKGEGFLTDIRSRIVSRKSLNELGEIIGLEKIVKFNGEKNDDNAYKSLYGDVMEALIGAVYVDKGYKFCTNFILTKLIQPHIDLAEVVENNPNFKSILLEWAHKGNLVLKFRIINEEGKNHNKTFTAQAFLNDEAKEIGVGLSKKKAEQEAAEKTCKLLNIA